MLPPVALLIIAMFCQSFEVASVKTSKSPGGRIIMTGGPGTTDPGRISYTNITLRRVLLTAYDVKNYQLVGPEWLDTARFDITATIPEGATKEQFQAMLRDFLSARFKMTTHRESKELPIYALLPAKNGLKIKSQNGAEPAEEQAASMKKDEGKDGFPVLSLPTAGLVIETRNGRARVTAKDVPLAKLADLLSGQAGCPVFDLTSLDGNYSFVLYFTPEGGDSPEPFLFAALQEQLGLKLEPRKGPVELLIIDHIERVPTEN
jgi:uncharacterized protein (TIGR03435 family)